ncbi:MAG: Calx-beta domain-containing protein [Verrucomicrobiales bacterium]
MKRFLLMLAGSAMVAGADRSIAEPILFLNSPETAEGSAAQPGVMEFTLTLSEPSDQTVTVDFATADLTAVAGTHYLAASGTATIPPGETTATIAVTLIGDATETTATREIGLQLSNPTGASVAYLRWVARSGAVGALPAPSPLEATLATDGVRLTGATTSDATVPGTVGGSFLGSIDPPSDPVDIFPAGVSPDFSSRRRGRGHLGLRRSGADQVFVFERGADGGWHEAQTLTGTPASNFGASVAVSGDRIAVGAPEDSAAGASAGAVIVFEKSGGNWAQSAKLTPGAPASNTGSSVALDGNTMVAGAPAESSFSGAAYGFTHDGSGWISRRMAAPVFQGGAEFGTSVAASGGWIVVGEPKRSPTGAAYAFRRDGITWPLRQTFSRSGFNGTNYGRYVAVAGGNLVIGEPDFYVPFPPPAPTPRGMVHAFALDAQGTWAFSSSFVAKDFSNMNGFGTGVAIAPNGIWLAGVRAAIPFEPSGLAFWEVYAFEPLGTKGKILDDDIPVIAAFDLRADEPTAGSAVAHVPIRLNAAIGSTATVTYQTVDGTAKAGFDYAAASGTATIARGATEALVPITIFSDAVAEGEEEFYLDIVSVVPSRAVIADDRATVKIRETPYTVTISRATIANGFATFDAQLDRPRTQLTQIPFTLGGGNAVPGEDYDATPGTLFFGPGSAESQIFVELIGGSAGKPDRYFGILLDLPAGFVRAPVGPTVRAPDFPPLDPTDITLVERFAKINGWLFRRSNFLGQPVREEGFPATNSSGGFDDPWMVEVKPTGFEFWRRIGEGEWKLDLADEVTPSTRALISGDSALVRGNTSEAGREFIFFARTDGANPEWSEVARLATDRNPTDLQGSIAIARPSAGGFSDPAQAVLIYENLPGSGWQATGMLPIPASNIAGLSTLSPDGKIAVAARDSGSPSDPEFILVFEKQASAWVQTHTVEPPESIGGNRGIIALDFASPTRLVVAYDDSIVEEAEVYSLAYEAGSWVPEFTLAPPGGSWPIAFPDLDAHGDSALFGFNSYDFFDAVASLPGEERPSVSSRLPPIPFEEGRSFDAPTGEFTIRFSEAVSSPIEVTFEVEGITASGSDFTLLTPSPLVIPAGSVEGKIRIAIPGDDAFEPDETAVLRITGVSRGTIATPELEFTIYDDDPRYEPDFYTVPQGGVLSVGGGGAVPGYAQNDIRPANTAVNVAPPGKFTILDSGEGYFRYTPAPNVIGEVVMYYGDATGDPIPLVGSQQAWRYYHPLDGVDPATLFPNWEADWAAASFDDSAWPSGSGLMGYGTITSASGNLPINTNIGTPPSGLRRTAYFRAKFNSPASGWHDISVQLSRDDAAILYLDGEEIGRSHQPGATIFASSPDSYSLMVEGKSTAWTESVEEGRIRDETFSPLLLREGENVLAISLHNSNTPTAPTSSDLALRVLSVTARRPGTPVTIHVEDRNLPPVLANDLIVIPPGAEAFSSATSGASLYANDGLLAESGLPYDPILGAQVSGSAAGWVTAFDPQTGHITLAIPPSFAGATSLSYTVTDKDGTSAPATVTVATKVDGHLAFEHFGTIGTGIYAAIDVDAEIPAGTDPLVASLSLDRPLAARSILAPVSPTDIDLAKSLISPGGEALWTIESSAPGQPLVGDPFGLETGYYLMPLYGPGATSATVAVAAFANADPIDEFAVDRGSAPDLMPLVKAWPVCGIERAAIFGYAPAAETYYFRFQLRPLETIWIQGASALSVQDSSGTPMPVTSFAGMVRFAQGDAVPPGEYFLTIRRNLLGPGFISAALFFNGPAERDRLAGDGRTGFGAAGGTAGDAVQHFDLASPGRIAPRLFRMPSPLPAPQSLTLQLWAGDAALAQKTVGGEPGAVYLAPLELPAGSYRLVVKASDPMIAYHLAAPDIPDPAEPLGTYAAWAAALFGPEAPDTIAGRLADIDGDGLSNAAERALRLNPFEPSALDQAIMPDAAGGGALLFRFRAPAIAPADLTYRIEFSPTLGRESDWQVLAEGWPGAGWAGNATVIEAPDPGGDPGAAEIRCTFTPPQPATGSGFVRVSFLDSLAP